MKTLTKIILAAVWLICWFLVQSALFDFWVVSYNAYPPESELIKAKVLQVVCIIIAAAPICYLFVRDRRDVEHDEISIDISS